ncbi:LysR family transcriptional regulator [Mogibacterium timidum]|uniref:LysR substrate-binding domain protein n=2 Tax=Mogibacterium timidum TaxID=35519 RepID=X8IRJ7_9FIRM|nr:LysR family transcriptional regulator [Mogibacterium timidum]EUC52733.1 LysR substrate-binding domain protein [Mogibacterium timidum ATCC 33093]NWO22717.1 LysR family transcriptional regulator [Mogibacterium timidum]
MENRNVATFIKVVEMNNFTRAAESLGYSQAAVTAQIKQLEHELGAPLFDRIGKRINLTRAGEAFLPYAFRLLKAEDEAIACIREQGDLSGTLRIGTTSSLSIGALPQAAIDFIKEHPNVNIVIQVSDFTKDLREKLIAGTMDLVWAMTEPPNPQNFQRILEKDVPIVFVAHPDHPLAGKKVSLRKILAEQLIVADREVGYTYYLNKFANDIGVQLEPVLEIGSVSAIINILEGGYGVSYLPYFVVQQAIEDGNLALIDVSCPDPELKSNIICHKGKWIDPVIKNFIEFINERI